MKILIYLGHPAQFHFIKNIISQLYANGHQVKILLKTKDMLEELIQCNGFEYENIQIISRKNNKMSILWAALRRTIRVLKIARKFDADILIGTDASIAQAGFLLRRPAITTLEDDYDVISKLANLTYPFTTSIVVPLVCQVGSKWENKKIAYHGYMKLAYLHPNYFTPDKQIVRKYLQTEKYCIIRLAQLTAHHDEGIKGLNVPLVRRIIEIAEQKGYKVYISSEAVLDENFSGYQLKIDQNDIHHLMAFASLLISDSQSMSVEAAMLGVPSIRFSDFAGRISVLEELEEKYQLTFGICTIHSEKLIKRVIELLSEKGLNKLFQERRCQMLNDKIDVTAFMVWFVENYPVSEKIMKANPDYQNKFKGSNNLEICDEEQVESTNQLIEHTPTETLIHFPVSKNENKVIEPDHNQTWHPVSLLNKLKSMKNNSDFSYSVYRQLLESIRNAGYDFYTFEDWCNGKAKGRFVILRHDVDLRAAHSLATAKIEAEMGIRSSYYFRVVPQSNQPTIIRAIAELNHEIGYHYEDMTIFNGDLEKSMSHFIKQLEYFRQFYPVRTISMHGSPASKWDNRDLWKTNNYRDYGIIGEPYLDLLTHDSLSKGEITYLTDTARMWDGDKYNVRDKRILDVKEVRATNRKKKVNIHSTFDFINWLKTKPPVNAMMITTHPQRWTDNTLEWFIEYFMQNLKNLVKQLFFVS